MISSITLENFRCFREIPPTHLAPPARLAPLTLLVGENSTGKTSFMAMIRALWDVAYGQQSPDFKESPYELGSYDEIAYHRNANNLPADSFKAGFEITQSSDNDNKVCPYYFEASFEKEGTIPVAKRRLISQGKVSFNELYKNNTVTVTLKTARGSWLLQTTKGSNIIISQGRVDYNYRLVPLHLYHYYMDLALHRSMQGDMGMRIQSLANSPDFSEQDLIDINNILDVFSEEHASAPLRPYASAPVRSKPKRTYDPSRSMRDPEGDYVPMYLAYLDMQDRETWNELQRKLESFGTDSRLFDQISIKRLGSSVGNPFQIQIRKFSKRKGPQRNLIDVGYGVSQILPLITELLRKDAPDIFLVQQPEVHLHPSAQAALGSLFCQVAGNNKQLIIETHSDYILDRIRMDIRDKASPLKPEDVSLLFFERKDQDVKIHSLRHDEQGNVLGTPPGYRQFFMEEVRRSIGI